MDRDDESENAGRTNASVVLLQQDRSVQVLFFVFEGHRRAKTGLTVGVVGTAVCAILG